MFENLGKDFALATRGLLRAPLFTAVAVLTFMLGIGGTATMFTAVNAAFLQPLPYPDADHLTALWQTHEENRQLRVSMLDSLDWAAQNRSFAHMAALGARAINVTSGSEPRRSTAAYVTRDFFATLGVPPRLGRSFSAEEMLLGGPRVVLIGHGLWKNIFHGDTSVLGKPLSIEGVGFSVIGVMPQGFSFPEDSDLWLPLSSEDGAARSAHNYQVIGRLKPGISLEQAQADLDTVAHWLAETYPDSNAGYGIAIVPLRRDLLGRAGPSLLLLLGAVSLVLLIACANVTNLLFVRSVARHTETTLRLALGASRGALTRFFMAESVILAFVGGALGMLIALSGSRLLAGLAPVHVLASESFRVDGTVLAFTFLVSLGVGLLCGAMPALRASRQDLRTALAAGGRSVLGGSSRGMNTLIVTEVALAFVLLVGAGLLVRSARRLEAVGPGFQPQNVSIVNFAMGGLSGSRYEEAGWRVRFFDQLLDRAARIPGVERAGVVSQPPLSGGSFNGTLEVENRTGDPAGSPHEAHYRLMGGDYFAALGIPLKRGRSFGSEDRADTPKVAIVNERLARDLAPDGSILGQRVRIPGMDGIEDWALVVGVVGDVRHRGLAREAVPEIYFPYVQRPGRTWQMALVVQSTVAPKALSSLLRDQVKALDSGLPFRFETMSSLIAADLAQSRFRAELLGSFAGTALLLAAVGIFGVVSYSVGRRNREVGIRMALGADRGRVKSLILRGGMAPVLIGIAIGLLAALALSRVLANLVFGVGVNDPATFASVALVLGAAAFAAVYFPAHRATRVDPLTALRAE